MTLTWKELPQEIVEVDKISIFYKHLDKYMDRKNRGIWVKCRQIGIRCGILVIIDELGRRVFFHAT